MYVILSQRIDFDSSYSDELFNSYHYPSKYKNQLHKGDIFIYYQGNRYDKSQRYYFGVGTVGEIITSDGENYYAKLIDCQQFEKKVPIYLPDGGYIEQLGYETVRKSLNPPWQSSIRPISQEAYDYILNSAGVQNTPDKADEDTVGQLNEKLKTAVRDYYIGGDPSAIHRIESIASAIGRTTSIADACETQTTEQYAPSESSEVKSTQLIEYCRNMRLSYSYKPLLILALLHAGNKEGAVSIRDAAEYFHNFYRDRKARGLQAEKKKCIYLRGDVTMDQIMTNLIANPVKALVASGYFFYNEEDQVLSVSPEIWSAMNRGKKSSLTRICKQKLQEYYSD